MALEEILSLEISEALRQIDSVGEALTKQADDYKTAITEALSALDVSPTVDVTVQATGLEELQAAIAQAEGGLVAPVTASIDNPDQLTFDINDAIAHVDSSITPTIDASEMEAAISDVMDQLDTGVSGGMENLGQAAGAAGASMDEAGTKAFGLAGGLEAVRGLAHAATGSVGGLGEAAHVFTPAMGVATAAIGAFGIVGHEAFTEAEKLRSSEERLALLAGPLAESIKNINVGGLNTDFKSLSLSLGQSEATFNNIASRVLQMGSTSTLARDKVATLTDQVVALAARAVALNPSLGNIEATSQRLIQGLARGGPILNRFGISITPAELKDYATSLGYVFTSLDQTTKASLGAELATRKLGDALGGDITKGAQNIQTQFKSVHEELNRTLESVGLPLLDPLLGSLRETTPLLQALALLFGQVLQVAVPLAGTVAKDLAPALTTVANGAQLLGPMLNMLLKVFDLLPGPMQTAALLLLLFGTGLGPLPNVVGATIAAFQGQAVAAGEVAAATGTAAAATTAATAANAEAAVSAQAVAVATTEQTAAVVANTAAKAANVAATTTLSTSQKILGTNGIMGNPFGKADTIIPSGLAIAGTVAAVGLASKLMSDSNKAGEASVMSLLNTVEGGFNRADITVEAATKQLAELRNQTAGLDHDAAGMHAPWDADKVRDMKNASAGLTGLGNSVQEFLDVSKELSDQTGVDQNTIFRMMEVQKMSADQVRDALGVKKEDAAATQAQAASMTKLDNLIRAGITSGPIYTKTLAETGLTADQLKSHLDGLSDSTKAITDAWNGLQPPTQAATGTLDHLVESFRSGTLTQTEFVAAMAQDGVTAAELSKEIQTTSQSVDDMGKKFSDAQITVNSAFSAMGKGPGATEWLKNLRDQAQAETDFVNNIAVIRAKGSNELADFLVQQGPGKTGQIAADLVKGGQKAISDAAGTFHLADLIDTKNQADIAQMGKNVAIGLSAAADQARTELRTELGAKVWDALTPDAQAAQISIQTSIDEQEKGLIAAANAALADAKAKITTSIDLGDFIGPKAGRKTVSSAAVIGAEDILPSDAAIGTAVTNTMNAAGTTIGSHRKEMEDAGKNVSGGLVDGLNAGMPDVIAWADITSNKAITTIKNNFKISSPSAVMQDIGKDVVKGFALGLTDTEDASKAVDDIISQLDKLKLSATTLAQIPATSMEGLTKGLDFVGAAVASLEKSPAVLAALYKEVASIDPAKAKKAAEDQFKAVQAVFIKGGFTEADVKSIADELQRQAVVKKISDIVGVAPNKATPFQTGVESGAISTGQLDAFGNPISPTVGPAAAPAVHIEHLTVQAAPGATTEETADAISSAIAWRLQGAT